MMQIMKKSRAFLLAAVLILQLILLPLAEVGRVSASEVSDQLVFMQGQTGNAQADERRGRPGGENPTQVDQLKIVKGKDLCTLLTCTPYMINTHRLLVTGHWIPYNPKAEAKAKADKEKEQE